LQPGVPVELVVERGFCDADGGPLVDDARRRYEVGGDIRARVDPRTWIVTPPAAGSLDALRVAFERPLDRALLDHCLVVTRGDVGVLRGVRVPLDGESAWQFTPATPWSAGSHALVVDGMLEDLAGNSVTRVFDRELDDPAHDPLRVDHVQLDFVVS
jgi:hypothetical protein